VILLDHMAVLFLVLWGIQPLFSIVAVLIHIFTRSRMIFQSMWWMSLGFWWELPWTCRLLLVVLPFLLCWFCQSMSMGDLSIFYNFIRFLSLVTNSFPCRGHSNPLLSLFLSILLFSDFVNRIAFLWSFSIYSLLVYRKTTDVLFFFAILGF
jgi:hypothetical protein